MRALIDLTVSCTVGDQHHLIEIARKEVEASKPMDDWAAYYPLTPADALQILIRSAIASKLQSVDSVALHEIGHSARILDSPL